MGWALLRPRNPIQISCRRPLPCHQCPCQIVTFNAHLLTIKTNLSVDNNGQFLTSLVTLFSAHYQYVRWDFKLLEQKGLVLLLFSLLLFVTRLKSQSFFIQHYYFRMTTYILDFSISVSSHRSRYTGYIRICLQMAIKGSISQLKGEYYN